MSGMTHISYKTITPCTGIHSSTFTSHTYSLQSTSIKLGDITDGARCGDSLLSARAHALGAHV